MSHDTAPQEKKVSIPMGPGARTLITAAAAFVVLFGLKESREVAVPIVMAAFLAIISYPITSVLRRVRFPHWLAVAFTVVVDFGIISAVVWVVRFLARDVAANLRGNLTQQLTTKFNALMSQLDQWGIGDQARDLLSDPQSLIDPQQIISLSQSITGQIVSFMAVTTLVLILMTFMLGEAPLFRRNLGFLPAGAKEKAQILTALQDIQRYLLIKSIASFSTGMLAYWLCHVMSIPFAFLWGFVACVLNFIPTIGSIVAAVPPILLALLLGDWSTVLIVSLGYLAINSAIGNGIEPLFLGKQFGIATTVVLLSVIVWGWVWGPFGMLLAVPFTVLTKLALEYSSDFRWLAAIIADKPSQSQ